MSIKAFIAEVKKGLKSPVYLLTSDEYYLLSDALYTIRETIPERERDFRFLRFDFESDLSPSCEEIADVLHTVPFGGGRLTVIVENLQKAKDKTLPPLIKYIQKPATESLLVLLHQGEIKKKGLKEELKGVKTIPLTMRGIELPEWIREKASINGYEISDGAVDYLISVMGGDMGLIASEINKFTMLGKKTLHKNDIETLVSGTAEHGAFDLINAIKAKDKERAIKIYRETIDSIEPYSLLGALNWSYEKASGKKDKAFRILHEADKNIKTSGGAYPLEALISELLKL